MKIKNKNNKLDEALYGLNPLKNTTEEFDINNCIEEMSNKKYVETAISGSGGVFRISIKQSVNLLLENP